MRDTFHQTWFVRGSFSLDLNISREGGSTTFLGNLPQCLTTLSVKILFLTSNLNLLSFRLKPVTTCLCKSSSPSFWQALFPPGRLTLSNTKAKLPNYQTGQNKFSQPFLVERFSIPLMTFMAPPCRSFLSWVQHCRWV